jgi:light-regulated signal transduction histidine kinase (bacteriophytochrome)
VLLRTVLDDLLDDALKFAGRHPTARIEVDGRVERDERVFFVRDDGASFDPLYADKLFGAFQRLHSVEDFPGTGIGLATVQRIVRRHGGRVWAEGAPERGATFWFSIPDAPRDDQ